MQLITNSVDPTGVVEETRNGDRYLIVKDVPFIREMELSGGWVPESNIKQTINEWEGRPLTANHPRDEQGQPVPAHTKLDEVGVGKAENVYFDGTWGRSDLAINADRAEAMGGHAADIVQKIENEEKFDVSSQYAAEETGPMEIQGEIRDNVEIITRPDSIALLPHKRGKCSIENGECGINPELIANAEISVPMTQNAKHFDKGELVEWPFGDGTGRGRVTEIITEPGEVTRTIEGTEVTREVTEDEAAYVVEVWRGDEFDGEALKSGSELSEWSSPPEEAMRANQNVDYALTDVTPDDVDEYTDSEWDGSDAIAGMPNPSEDEDAPSVLDQAHLLIPGNEEARDDKSNWKLPFRTGPDAPVNTRALVAARAAINGARGGVEGVSQEDLDGAESRAVDFLVDAPDDLFGSMESEDDDMNGASEHMQSNSVFDMLANVAGKLFSTQTTGAESPVESNGSDTVDRDTLIQEITENSALTKAALNERCDDGLEAIHSDIMSANDSSDSSDDMTGNTDAITFESEEEFEEYVDEIVANRVKEREKQSQKQELAQDIVANSADYEDTEKVLEEFPTTAALEAKKDSLETNSGVPASGVSANFDGPDESSDIEVDSGVLTE